MTRKEKAAMLPEEIDYKKACEQLKANILKDMPFIPEKNLIVTHTYGIAPDQLVRSGGFMAEITNGKKGKAMRSLNIIAEVLAENIMEQGMMTKIEELEKEYAAVDKECKRLEAEVKRLTKQLK